MLLGDGADAGAKQFCQIGAGIEDQGHACGQRIVGQGQPTPTAEPVEKSIIKKDSPSQFNREQVWQSKGPDDHQNECRQVAVHLDMNHSQAAGEAIAGEAHRPGSDAEGQRQGGGHGCQHYGQEEAP